MLCASNFKTHMVKIQVSHLKIWNAPHLTKFLWKRVRFTPVALRALVADLGPLLFLRTTEFCQQDTTVIGTRVDPTSVVETIALVIPKESLLEPCMRLDAFMQKWVQS